MAAKKKQITIHKANEIIRGIDDYSLHAKRCMNAIYYVFQYNLNRNNTDILKMKTIPIEFSFLRKMMNLEKVESYISIIESSLKELEKTIELNNFYHPIRKKKYQWYSDRFLNNAGWELKENGKKYAEIELSDLAKYLIAKKSNFTELKLIPYLNKFRTKYAMKLYEYLKSFEKKYKYLDITDEHTRKLLNIENIKEYQYFSALQRLIERQVKEIQSKSDLKDLKMKAYKDLKTFRFSLNPKAEKKKPDKQTLEDILQKCIKKF